MLLRSVAIANNPFKSTAIARRDLDDNSCSHIESSNCFGLFGNRLDLTIALLYIGCKCKRFMTETRFTTIGRYKAFIVNQDPLQPSQSAAKFI